MSIDKATPKWQVGHPMQGRYPAVGVTTTEGEPVCDTWGNLALYHAERISDMHNSYDAMVEALQEVKNHLEYWEKTITPAEDKLLESVRAALKLARGEQ